MAGEKDGDDLLDDFDDEEIEVDGDNREGEEDSSLDLKVEDLPEDDNEAIAEGEGDGAAGDADPDEAPRKRNKLTAKERIDKAVRKQREAERARDAERAEKEELRKRLHETQTYVVKGNAASLTAAADKIRAELKQAIEDGDTDKQLELNDKLIDIRADIKRAAETASRMEREKPAPRDDGVQYDGPITDAPAEVKEKVYGQMNPLARNWAKEKRLLDQNPEVIGITVSVEASVMADGFDRNSPDYYAELDKRLKRRVPELYADQDEEQPRRRSVVASAVAGAPRRSGAGQPRPGNPKHLTAEQVSNMRRFNLDPANPAHRAEYAKNVSR